ncbi:hypothetical protein RHMOL_Rhmol01G0263900 [Rhododendron molle]|uniref:Uncharacterized protein n=1 Tax=Rhododendron molle TaxID=49168 RepID=A0ACC0Q8U9_RHOML|nr:hypothetical protein RHMOL_Rhmol01G0263900 [Rhododendron molle]
MRKKSLAFKKKASKSRKTSVATPTPPSTQSTSSTRKKNSSPYLRHSPYRANLRAAIKYIPMIELRKPHIELLKETPFWLLINILKEKALKLEEFRKVDFSVEMILKQYRGNGQFLIGKQLVELRVSDIQLIFGIRSGKEKVSGLYCSSNKVKFARRKNLQRLDQQAIKNMITEQLLKSNKKTDVEDVARLLCLFLCATLFFTTSATLSWVYVKHMDDWNKMKNYD